MSLFTTPRTWVTGEFVTAAMLNTEIRDALIGVQSAWTPFVPTWANFVPGNSTITADYSRVGRTLMGRVRMSIGSTASFPGGDIRMGLPVSVASNSDQIAIGTAYLLDASVGSGSRTIALAMVTGGSVFFVAQTTGGTVTNAVPWTWAVGDLLTLSFAYQTS